MPGEARAHAHGHMRVRVRACAADAPSSWMGQGSNLHDPHGARVALLQRLVLRAACRTAAHAESKCAVENTHVPLALCTLHTKARLTHV